MPIDDEVTRQTVRVYQANLAIIVCEAGLRLALTTRDRLTDRPRSVTPHEFSKRVVIDTYPDIAWLPDYFKELEKADVLVWYSPSRTGADTSM